MSSSEDTPSTDGARDSSGRTLSTGTSSIIKSATAASLIFIGLVVILMILKITKWIKSRSEKNRLRSVQARLSNLGFINHHHLSHQQHHHHHHQPQHAQSHLSHQDDQSLIDLIWHGRPDNRFRSDGSSRFLGFGDDQGIFHGYLFGRTKLRNAFDIKEYEGLTL
ncbi:hypothetical protein BY996DRAFT_2163997 [Phakopsora pachyrhizi]|nr:hypothetical protein BY996DRAFT_2163997 [Phakopsora pachyrhizi]